MERLTDEVLHNAIKTYEITSEIDDPDYSAVLDKCILEFLHELKAYRDAEEQGLLIRLPCAVGDTVYAITTCKDFEKVLDGTLWDSGGGFGTATGYYCPYELNDSCPHEQGFEECEGGCECFGNKFAIFEDSVEGISVYQDNTFVYLEYCGCFSSEDFGRIVFLTREEAEAALAKIEE